MYIFIILIEILKEKEGKITPNIIIQNKQKILMTT